MKIPPASTNAIDIVGLRRDRALRTGLLRDLRKALRPLTVAPVTAQVRFVDDNGPKGGLGTRCTMTVSLPYEPDVRVEHVAATARVAFDGALARLLRRLERYRERQREQRRRPKKYYVAKRLLEG